VISRAEVTDAVLAAARAGGRRVGDGEAPDDSTVPYSVLEIIPGPGEQLEDFGALHRNGALRFRVCSVGSDPGSTRLGRRQAQRESDLVRAALLTPGAVAPPEGAAWSVRTVRIDGDGGTDRAGPVWNTFVDYLVTINGG